MAQVLTQICKNYGLKTKGDSQTINYFDTVVIKDIK